MHIKEVYRTRNAKVSIRKKQLHCCCWEIKIRTAAKYDNHVFVSSYLQKKQLHIQHITLQSSSPKLTTFSSIIFIPLNFYLKNIYISTRAQHSDSWICGDTGSFDVSKRKGFVLSPPSHRCFAQGQYFISAPIKHLCFSRITEHRCIFNLINHSFIDTYLGSP